MDNILIKLEKLKASGNNSERNVSHYILNNLEEVRDMQASELASNCFVSNSVISKFIKKLGFANYQEFCYHLREMVTQVYDVDLPNYFNVDKYANDILSTIVSTNALMNESDILFCREMIMSSNRVIISGIGGSGSVGYDFRLKLYKLGFNAFFETDKHMLQHSITYASHNDVIIIFSYSGPGPEILDYIKKAYDNGATTILITASSSEMTGFSKVLKVASTDMSLRNVSITSRIALSMISDIIVLGLDKRN